MYVRAVFWFLVLFTFRIKAGALLNMEAVQASVVLRLSVGNVFLLSHCKQLREENTRGSASHKGEKNTLSRGQEVKPR